MKGREIMRKLIGFIFFIISLVIIVAIVIANLSLFSNFVDALGTEDAWAAIVILAGALWSVLYQPIVVLLLSVIAMGSYSK